MSDYLFPELAADAETKSKNAREVAELTAKRHKPEPGPPTPAQAQNYKEAILAELRQGPVFAKRLAEICIGYRQRVSQLRDDGYAIKCRAIGKGRHTLYSLEGEP